MPPVAAPCAVPSCSHSPVALPKNVTPFAPSIRRRAARVVRASASASGEANVYDAVIVGGGLSGLVTGQALAAKHGVTNFLVTEARERVGGNITSMEGNGYVWEEGPNSFQPNDAMLQVAVRVA